MNENRSLREEFENRKSETIREYQDLQEELDRQEQLISIIIFLLFLKKVKIFFEYIGLKLKKNKKRDKRP